LRDDPDADDLRHRHAQYFLGLAERVEPTWLEDLSALAWLLPDSDNVRAALRWASEHGESESGLRLAGALGPLWNTGPSTTEGRAWLRRLLADTSDETPVRARALWLAGRLAMRERDTHAAETHLREALALARKLADPTTSVRSLYELGAVH